MDIDKIGIVTKWGSLNVKANRTKAQLLHADLSDISLGGVEGRPGWI